MFRRVRCLWSVKTQRAALCGVRILKLDRTTIVGLAPGTRDRTGSPSGREAREKSRRRWTKFAARRLRWKRAGESSHFARPTSDLLAKGLASTGNPTRRKPNHPTFRPATLYADRAFVQIFLDARLGFRLGRDAPVEPGSPIVAEHSWAATPRSRRWIEAPRPDCRSISR